ncbi:MAG: ABC transporter, substrate-binding protein (cluster 9, phospholipid) [uncultured Ramlibacter sp.]|uniref:ABC transporter, substrate-binding protein (Cluster 9, phospholipid) n=1 Tax=uncultured Ramlibacter sp. TaxID=260755 RepID=A0A6J4NPN2_9BURK|nr:MAG: ABC transporter, substrate-binding protein (cluster 9, phospholipid) [uncultured Ramlibacter sp.]
MAETPLQDSEPAAAPPVPHLAAKARLLLLFTLVLILSSVGYLLYARGVFESTQQLVLTTDDSEGVSVGMDMTFSGFPIGRVRRVELADSGNVRIVIDVAQKDAHWLRTSSVFTLVRGLVGGTAIRAFTGVLTDPPLPDGAERPVLRGDATAEIPRVIASAREVLENLSSMTAQGAELRTSLANVQELTEKLKGPQGALGVLFGNEGDARKLMSTVDRANALLARADRLAGKADAQVFGPEGVMREARATVVQLNGLLGDTRASLKRVDAVLVEAQGVGANVRGATEDLGVLRGEVEANLRKVEALINEINRKWPFTRDTEIKLP